MGLTELDFSVDHVDPFHVARYLTMIRRTLDLMFSCTPAVTGKVYIEDEVRRLAHLH